MTLTKDKELLELLGISDEVKKRKSPKMIGIEQ